jgi:protein-S-isoprenylcysteine O-methyltransferase Ste14
LAFRCVAGFVQLLFGLSALVFIPAWTLAFWQAWLFLAVFFGCSGVISLYLWMYDRTLLESRVNGGPQAESQPEQRRLQAFAAIAFVGIFLIASVDHRLALSKPAPSVAIVGDLLVAIGFAIILFVFRANTFAAATIGVAARQRVISTGPYAIVRHPLYAGAIVMLAGVPLALGSWWSLIALIPMFGVLVARLIAEERFLRAQLWGYTAYTSKVKYRLVPRLW